MRLLLAQAPVPTPTTPAPAPAPGTPPQPQTAERTTGPDLADVLLVGAGALVVLLLLIAVVVALARWRAWSPGWALDARHAVGEAGVRAGAGWADLRDWLLRR